MRNMPAPNLDWRFTISTMDPDLSSVSHPRPGAFISAPDDVHGIRKITPRPHRWPRTNISATGFSKAPACRHWAANISSCISGIAGFAPRAMSVKRHLNISENWAAVAFTKPLLGSRGDFAQAVHSEAALLRYLDEVSRYYDAVLIQPLVSGIEYRVFLLDDEVLYTARKYPPSILGDGVRTIRDLLAAHDASLQSRGLSPVSMTADHDRSLDAVLPKCERWDIPGRMNLSAGGAMLLEALRFRVPCSRTQRRRHAHSGSASPRWTCLPISAAIQMRYG